MSVYKITFSPTGGTEKAAACLAAAFGQDIQSIDLTDPAADYGRIILSPDDICITAVPSFGGRVPAAAASRLAKIQGQGAKAIAAVVYGNRDYDDTLLELQNILAGAGFRCAAAVAAVAEHSILRQFAQGRPDAEDEAQLGEFAGKIRAAIEADSINSHIALPGHTPYREYKGVPMKPRAGKGCTSCGLCAQKCPVRAIPAESPSQTDTETCISCMRCVAICPSRARSVNSLMLAAAAQKLKKSCQTRRGNELFL